MAMAGRKHSALVRASGRGAVRRGELLAPADALSRLGARRPRWRRVSLRRLQGLAQICSGRYPGRYR